MKGVDVDQLPFVSIIVPVYNEEENIRKCIRVLLNQSYPRSQYEILIVDGNSSDNTQCVVREYPVKLLVEDKRSSYAARNMGIHNAKGEILAFTDADAIVSYNWLQEGVNSIIKNNADYVGCQVKLYTKDEVLTYWDLYDINIAFDVAELIKIKGFAPTVGLFVKRSLIEQVGMFDPRLVSCGDAEFGDRVREAGFKQFYAEKAVVYHPTRSTLKDQIERALRIGQGKFQLSVYYPERYGKPISNLLNPLEIFPFRALAHKRKLSKIFSLYNISPIAYTIRLFEIVGKYAAFVYAKNNNLN